MLYVLIGVLMLWLFVTIVQDNVRYPVCPACGHNENSRRPNFKKELIVCSVHGRLDGEAQRRLERELRRRLWKEMLQGL
jgi:hypothetical protein